VISARVLSRTPRVLHCRLRDKHPLFVRLGRHGREQPEPLSAEAVYRLVNRDCLALGIPARLAHPHALPSYWATHLRGPGQAAQVTAWT
jgi:integrase